MRPLLPVCGRDRRSAGVQSVEPHRASAWIPFAGIGENGSKQLAEAAVKSVKQWIYSPSAMTSVIDVSIPFEARQ